MTEADLKKLFVDLVGATQVDIRGRPSENGTSWSRQAPRSRGYHTFVWPGPPALLRVGKEGGMEEDWVMTIAEIGEIQIWTDPTGPSILWEASGNGPLVRSTF